MKLPRFLRPVPSRVVHTALPGFDRVYYQYWYRDTLQYTGEPFAHYLIHGWREGRDPSAGFSTRGYLAENADVRESGVNPLVHFLEHGLAEGRLGWQKDPTAPPPLPTLVLPPLKLLAPPRSA